MNASLPIRSVAALVVCARSKPEGVQVGTSGIARTTISGRAAAVRTELNFSHVPFRGGSDSLTNTIAGHVPVVVGVLPPAQRPAREGRVRSSA
ncbi:MAG: hypothetical protein IRZ13_04975 [Acetobacteraceae bacterium]|nr:hypothetical protein [Acetobacteraceae bacterium]